MSWNVGDDEWLAEPMAVPGAGPVDELDDRVISALARAGRRQPQSGQSVAPPPVATPVEPLPEREEDAPVEGLPPPPHSAAFDEEGETPSYESGSFVAEVEEVEDDEPDAQSDEPEAEMAFHIPTLSVAASAPEPAPAAPQARVDTAPLAASSSSGPVAAPGVVVPPLVSAPQAAAPVAASQVSSAVTAGELVIPTLSRPPEAREPSEDGVEEVEAEELEEVEEVDAVPVRTGDTVIARAPQAEVEPPRPAASITESVYDDDDEDDEPIATIPELVERVDSSELEIVPDEDTAVDAAPADPDADTVVEPAPPPEPEEPAGLVIPTLARPEPETDALDASAPVEAEHEQAAADSDAAAFIPTLLAPAQTVEASPPVVPEVVPEVVVETEVEEVAEVAEEVEDVQEVEAEAIESLDTADLEELEQPAVAPTQVEAEAKPPAPPEAKPQAKRRKAWYDDVFAEHFLFLYPLTWEDTCQRDAQFVHALLGEREGLSILDVGCGDGRHAVELAKLGARVLGLDNSLALLLAAAQVKEIAELEDGRVDFVHGDMRRLPRDREFDAVLCIGTTLGYFEEEQNWLCLQEMHDRLAPGGRLLVHVFNRDFVAPHLPSRSWWQGKRCMVIDEAEMNFFANRLRVHRTIIFDDGRQYEHYMFMRAYTVQDLGKAISQLGMRVIEVSGSRDTRGRFYGSASPDIWIVAEKKP